MSSPTVLQVVQEAMGRAGVLSYTGVADRAGLHGAVDQGKTTEKRSAVSVTPVTISTGRIRLVLDRAAEWDKGTPVYVAADDVAGEGQRVNVMVGTVFSSASTLLDIDVTATAGSGCFKAWTVTRFCGSANTLDWIWT